MIQYVIFYVQFLSLNPNVFEVHPKMQYLLMAEYFIVWVCQLFYALICWWILESFLTFGYNAAVYIHVLQTYNFISPGSIPGIRIAESYGNFVVNFLRNHQTGFHSSYSILFSCQQCTEVLISPHPYQHVFCCYIFLIVVILIGMR